MMDDTQDDERLVKLKQSLQEYYRLKEDLRKARHAIIEMEIPQEICPHPSDRSLDDDFRSFIGSVDGAYEKCLICSAILD